MPDSTPGNITTPLEKTHSDLHLHLMGDSRFRNMVMQIPVGIAILRGRDLVIEMANDAFLQIIGKTEKEFTGKPLFESIPEVREAAEPMLVGVLETGKSYSDDAFEMHIDRFEKREKAYFNFVYQPLFEEGVITGVIVVAHEVTEQVKIRQHINDDAERLRLATEGTQISTWDMNLRTREIIHSPRLAEIFGHDASHVMTHPEMRAQLHPDDKGAIVEKAFDVALRSGTYLYEARIIRPDHSICWIRTHGSVIFDNNGVPLRMLGTLMDITQRKKSEEDIARLAAIVQSSDDGIISKGLDGIVTSWNEAARNIFGYSAEEMIGQHISRIIPEDRLEEETLIIDRLKSDKRIDHFITQRLTKHNQLIDVALSVSPVKSPDGRIIGASKIVRDITAQVEAERLVRESEQKFRLLADVMPQFIWTSDEQGNINYFNQSVFSYSGLDMNVLINRGWFDIVHPDDQDETIRQWQHSVKTGEPFHLEHRFHRHDGEYRWHLSRAIPKTDVKGRVDSWIGTSTDIHDHKLFTDELEKEVQQRTSELKRANEELLKSNSELAQFAYVASHDLQEPLRKIQAFSSRIQEIEGAKLSEKGRDYFTRMRTASSRMQQLILDLLMYSRANNTEKLLEQTDLNTLLKTVFEQLKETIDQKNAKFILTELPVLNLVPFQFEQLFTNLLTNALKFARPGISPVITIGYDVISGKGIVNVGANPSRKYHHISVADNGIGFDPQFSGRIFQVFQRLHGKQEYAGTGIGLAIVKKIVENHHGYITATAKPSEGAVFHLYLPMI